MLTLAFLADGQNHPMDSYDLLKLPCDENWVAIITEENGKQDGEHSNIGWTEKEGRRGFVLNADAKQFLECMSWTEEVVVTTSRKVQGLHATTNVFSIWNCKWNVAVY